MKKFLVFTAVTGAAVFLAWKWWQSINAANAAAWADGTDDLF